MRTADRRAVHSERYHRNEGGTISIAYRSTDTGQDLDQEYGKTQ